ncbi:MAG: orotate phosphoribosyltransferase-like protein [Euryarchaeota archaeon]|nr:orotate phosphoribosyltransferase-like protein [Euryarchaeota archaeon]
MNGIDELTKRVIEMKENGMQVGQIADELNISKETVTYLRTHASKKTELRAPQDMSMDWRSIGESSYRLRCISDAVADMILDNVDAAAEIDVVVGIAVSGIPLASIVANELGTKLAIFYPNKQLFGTENTDAAGIFSHNFADAESATCVLVDDVITTGGTLTETIKQLTEMGAKPIAIAVLVDKLGKNTIEGVPVFSLLRTLWVS